MAKKKTVKINTTLDERMDRLRAGEELRLIEERKEFIESPKKEWELDIVSGLFGMIHTGHDEMVHLYMEDDGAYFFKFTIHQRWVIDLSRTSHMMRKKLFS